MWARVGEVTARLLLSPTLAYSCPTLLHHKHTALQHVCQLHLLFRTAVCYYLAIVSCVPAQHTVTIAPHLSTTTVAATNNATGTSIDNTSSYASHQQIHYILLGYAHTHTHANTHTHTRMYTRI
jgi:hypothetical protein